MFLLGSNVNQGLGSTWIRDGALLRCCAAEHVRRIFEARGSRAPKAVSFALHSGSFVMDTPRHKSLLS